VSKRTPSGTRRHKRVKARPLEERIEEWSKQPGAFMSRAEWKFISDMRRAASDGVGYGFMQQMCQWEWDWKLEQELAALKEKPRVR
jgi:hypothetical protein